MTEQAGQVVSANDLFDGYVVYLDRHGDWTKSLGDAAIAEDKAAAASLLGMANVQSDRVVGPYLVDVAKGGDAFRPIHIREKLRDSGPSILPARNGTTG